MAGRIGRTIKESTPWWPAKPRPPKGAPNILVVLFDDVGHDHQEDACQRKARENIDDERDDEEPDGPKPSRRKIDLMRCFRSDRALRNS